MKKIKFTKTQFIKENKTNETGQSTEEIPRDQQAFKRLVDK